MSHVQQLLALTSSSCLMGSNGSGGSCTFGIDNERRKICGKAWLKGLVAQHFRSPKRKKKPLPQCPGGFWATPQPRGDISEMPSSL